MTSPAYLFNDAVVDRHARLANRLEVAPADEFAQRVLHLTVEMKQRGGTARVPSFMARTNQFRGIFGEQP